MTALFSQKYPKIMSKIITLDNRNSELVYYYIGNEENCLMTFLSIFNNSISKVYAMTEEDFEVLLFSLTVLST